MHASAWRARACPSNVGSRLCGTVASGATRRSMTSRSRCRDTPRAPLQRAVARSTAGVGHSTSAASLCSVEWLHGHKATSLLAPVLFPVPVPLGDAVVKEGVAAWAAAGWSSSKGGNPRSSWSLSAMLQASSASPPPSLSMPSSCSMSSSLSLPASLTLTLARWLALLPAGLGLPQMLERAATRPRGWESPVPGGSKGIVRAAPFGVLGSAALPSPPCPPLPSSTRVGAGAASVAVDVPLPPADRSLASSWTRGAPVRRSHCSALHLCPPSSVSRKACRTR